jgi:fumarylacetoacetate (FAA) hydrolase
MRLATILPRASLSPVPVVADPDGSWVELSALTQHSVPRLEDALPWVMQHVLHLGERAAAWKGPRYRASEFDFLPPVVTPAAFRDFDAFEIHARHLRALRGLELPEAWFDAPAFFFANRLSLVGHCAAVRPPAGSSELDFGLALGIVIGRRGRDIPAKEAWAHIAGLTVINDLSARDLERRAIPVGLGPSKGKDFATAAGPWLVPLSDFADRIQGERLSLSMIARVNGRELSRCNTEQLHHSIPSLVAQASRDAELYPGDLLSTGTAGGGSLSELGAGNGSGWLAPGDRVELEVERIGILETIIAARA